MPLEHTHGGNLNKDARKYGLQVKDITDFSANINPLGPSRKALSAISKNLDLISAYPDPDCTELKSELAKYLGIKEERLLMGNGAAELVYLLVRVLRCRKALIPVPTFCEYALAVLSQGGEVLELPLPEENGFRLPVDEIIASLPDADLLFLCNPNNPTGRLTSRKTILTILEKACLHRVMVVIDEAFMDFVPRREFFSVVKMAGQQPNLAVLYSMTKFFGIPGLRLGAIAGPGELLSRMNAARDPWNVNVLAQVAGAAGLTDYQYMRDTCRIVNCEKKFLFGQLASLPGVHPLPAAANFILADVAGSGFTSFELTELLGRQGILVRECSDFNGLAGRFLRLAVKTRPENEKLLLALKAILQGENK
ncbi:MAG TPA: threonine-phosphate decarboxylase [Pelotomaculum sp.]|nr:threonine-phosphate decarboxylase [Pelotomaculum sp.]